MIPCTFRQLEIFLAAAEDCHFVRTANRLGISQPAVTHHILALEAQLGRQLFVRRRGTTPVLSSDGIAFLSQARQVLDEGEKINSFRNTAQHGEQKARVTVCAGQHILDDCLKPRLHEFFQEEPSITLDCVLVDALAQGVQMVKGGYAELLVFAAARPEAHGLHSEVIRTIRFGLYASPQFAEFRDAGPEAISELPFILPSEGAEQDSMVQAELKAAGIYCANVPVRAQYSDVIVDLARHGIGVAALFETMVADSVAKGELIRIGPQLSPRFRTMFRLERQPPPAVVRVEAYLRRILA